jgi:hypothetical protein
MMSKEALFDYFSNFEEYPVRYPKHCGQVDIISRSDNEIITREFWNIQLPQEYELIEVRYQLFRPTEIKYEIIGDARLGINNMMQFSVSNNSSTVSTIEYSLPMIDIVRRLCGHYSRIYEDFKIYLLGQDSLHMQNNQNTRFALGQYCSICKTGILGGSANNEFTEYEDMSFRVYIERFECDSCHKIFSNSMTVTGGGIRFSTQSESHQIGTASTNDLL